MNNKYYPVAFLIFIAIAAYVMFGDAFKAKVDYAEYKAVCKKYLADTQGEFSTDDKQMLVNQVNYLLPENISELKDPLKSEIKNCASQLSQQLHK